MIEVEIFEHHLGVEDVFLIDVHIDHVIRLLHAVGHEVLNGGDVVVDEVLHALGVACEAAHAVVDGDDIGAERAKTAFRMAFRTGVHADMAFVEVGDHAVRQWAGVFRGVDRFWVDRLFADQNRNAGTLWFVVLAGDVEDVGLDD